MNYIHGGSREQMRIESIESYVDEDSEVRVIDKIIDTMDIESLGFKIGNNESGGRPKFDPRDLLKLYVYGYLNGIKSSRKLAKQCIINREVIWLLKDIKPKYRVISDFRKESVEALETLFKTFVDYCIDLGLYGKDLIALDGTKFEASASKRRHYSRNKISKMKELADNKIKEYLHEIEVADRVDDKESIDKESINIKINDLNEKIKHYDELEKIMDETGENEINLTDNDAKTVKFGAHQGTDLGYNVQAVVDEKNKLFTTFEVINNSADQGQLFNMSNKAKKIYNVETLEVLADKGYFEGKDIEKCEMENIVTYVSKPDYSNGIGDARYFIGKFKYNAQSDTYICPEGQVLPCRTKKVDAKFKEYINSEACSKCLNREKCTKAKDGRVIKRDRYSDSIDRMNDRIETDKTKYSQRKCIVEHPFGTLKRTMNFTYLLLRNFVKVRGEISLAFFSYNLKRVINIIGVKELIEALVSFILLKMVFKYKIIFA